MKIRSYFTTEAQSHGGNQKRDWKSARWRKL